MVMSTTARTRNVRGQGNLLRAEVLDAVDRLVGDDERFRPKSLALREVAREAGISAPAIYQHFANKEELIEAAVTEGFDVLTESMRAAEIDCGENPKATDILAAQARAYCRFADRHRGFFRLMFTSGALIENTADATDAVETLSAQWAGAASGLRAQGVKTELPPDQLAMFIWSAVHGRITLARVLEATEDEQDAFVDALITEILAVIG